MSQRARSFALLLPTALVLAGAVAAPLRAQMVVPDTFKHLKVLPKNITKDQLLTTMRSFTGALGVRCDYCHAEKGGTGAAERAAPPAGNAPGTAGTSATPPGNGQPGARPFAPPQFDFASDKKDQKRIARSMLRMVAGINKSYLAKMAELDTPRVQVSCITCHHGVSEPRTLADVLGEEVAQKGVAAAVKDYAQLKARYYGSAAYDFREGSLDELAGRLTAANHPDDALAILDLADREFPQSGMVAFLQGEALLKKGDRPGAIAKLQHALELQPRNEFVRRRLTEVQTSQ